MHAISDENTKQNEEILFYKAHQEVWFWLVHVECSFLLNKTNRITLGHLFIGYYFQRTEMILFNCKQLTHSFLWAVFILTSRMSDLAGDLWRGLHELFSLLSIKKWNSSKRERSYEPITAIMKLLRYFLLNDSNKMRFASWMSAPFPPDILFHDHTEIEYCI